MKKTYKQTICLIRGHISTTTPVGKRVNFHFKSYRSSVDSIQKCPKSPEVIPKTLLPTIPQEIPSKSYCWSLHLVPRCRKNFQLCRGVAWAVLEKLWVTSCTMGAMGAVNKNVSSQIYQTNSGKPNPLNQIYQTKLTNPCILNK